MNSLSIKPAKCPLCQNNWIEAPQNKWANFKHYICSSNCQLNFIIHESPYNVNFSVYKNLTDELEIW
jgi:hypothetical protein